MQLLPAVPPPELPAILSREYAFVPDHNMQKTAIGPDVSTEKSLRHHQSAGTVPSLQVIGSWALQSSSALPTTTLWRDTLRTLLLLAPHNEITGTKPKLGIPLLRTQGGRALITASDTNQQSQLQQMTFCILSIHVKYFEMLMFVTAVPPSDPLPWPPANAAECSKQWRAQTRRLTWNKRETAQKVCSTCRGNGQKGVKALF